MRIHEKFGFNYCPLQTNKARVFFVISRRDNYVIHGCDIALVFGRCNDRYLLSWIRIIIIPNQPRTSAPHVCSIYSRMLYLSLALSSTSNFATPPPPISSTSPTFQFSPRVSARKGSENIVPRLVKCDNSTETLIVTWQPNRMDRGGFSWTWTLEKGRVTDGVKSAGSWQEPVSFRD